MKENHRKLSLLITITVIALTIQKPEAFFDVRRHILPWTVVPGMSLPYQTWSSLQRFSLGDNIAFVFAPGLHTVAEVTKEVYDTCDTMPMQFISIQGSSPATFNLETVGEHYFICTVLGNCLSGQKVLITVSRLPELPPMAALPTSSGSDKLPDGPVTHIVGDRYGWAPPPSGSSDYTVWASNRTFHVGDKLVFNFVELLQDVALVKKSAYEKCDTNKHTIGMSSTSPATLTLNATGDYYFTTTNPSLCNFGQKLAISVKLPN